MLKLSSLSSGRKAFAVQMHMIFFKIPVDKPPVICILRPFLGLSQIKTNKLSAIYIHMISLL